LQKPSKGDIWPGFSTQRIQWSSTNIDNIKIESSLDSGKTWNTIVSSYPASAAFYDWQVPNSVSDSCYIRISDVLNPFTSSSNYKNNPFVIPKPYLYVDSINNIVYSRTSIPISWTFSGLRKINIYLSYDGLLKFEKIADSIIANNEYFNLIIRDTIANNCYLKIEDAANPILSDTIKFPFSIIRLPNGSIDKFKGGNYDGHSTISNSKTDLKLLLPNIRDSLIGSSYYTIKWKHNNLEKIKIEFSSDNGTKWNIITNNIAASANEYRWLVPNSPTEFGKIKITNLSDSSIFDESDSAFVIRKKELRIISPTQIDILKENTSFPISWSSIGIDKIKIKITGSTKYLTDSIAANNEVYNWLIENKPDSFRIIVQDVIDSTLSDTSSYLKTNKLPIGDMKKYQGGNFDGHTVLSNVKSSIKITNLNSRQIFATQSKIEIKWNAVNIEKVSAYLSIDSLKSWHLLSSSINANAGRHILQLPNVVAENCYIKLVSESDSNTTAISDSSFTLISKRLTNITDTVNWFVGLTKILSWEQVGVDTISISYKTKNSNLWTLLNNKYPTNGEIFNWVIPAIFDSLWVKLNDIVDTGIVSITSYHNKIKSNNIPPGNLTKYRGGFFDGHSFRSSVNKIIINRPNSNEVVIGGSAYSINWSTINISDSVLLEFSIDSGKTWITIGKVIATNGSYIWNIPSSITKSGNLIFDTAGISKENTSSENTISINSQNCLIRALDPYNNNEIVGISNKTFTIKTSETKLVNKIVFQKPLNLIWPENSKQKLIAQASSGRTVTVIIEKGDAAKIIADSIIATKSGKITIAAFDLGDNNFEKSDTVRYEICINPTKPVANNLSICNSTTVGPLSAIVSSGNTLLWYASNENSAISSTSPPVPSLSNIGITNFFVSQISKDGCESEKEKISVEIKVTPSSPSILRDNEGYLISNKFGNTWYKEDVKISDTTQKIRPSTNGYYSATSTQNGCISTMSEKFYYLTTAIQGLDINEYLRISPNPTRGYITINFKISNYNEIGFKLIDVTGKTIIPLQKLKTGSKMSLTNIISGSYILIAYNKDGVIIKTERIIKQ
jgi:hypothetical protein